MKTEKKQKLHGIKHKIRSQKKREQRIALGITVTFLIAIIFIAGSIINSVLNRPPSSPTTSSSSMPKAAIIDQLSLTHPNQTFIETATNTLKQAEYAVDYYSGEEVTVEFYRNLPTHGYKLVILRAHSALGEKGQPPLVLFTSETYSTNRYVFEQLNFQVASVYFTENREKRYFGVSPNFVKSSMNGEFQDSIIVLMGCNGLTYLDMAKAFLEKGAKACISWNSFVSASHTDMAITRLLQHFLTEKQTIRKAVTNTLKDVGADPVYNSLLAYYPVETGDYTIKSIVGNLVTAVQSSTWIHGSFWRSRLQRFK